MNNTEAQKASTEQKDDNERPSSNNQILEMNEIQEIESFLQPDTQLSQENEKLKQVSSSSKQADVLIDLELVEQQASLEMHEKQEDSAKPAADASYDDWLNQKVESSDSSDSDGDETVNDSPNAIPRDKSDLPVETSTKQVVQPPELTQGDMQSVKKRKRRKSRVAKSKAKNFQKVDPYGKVLVSPTGAAYAAVKVIQNASSSANKLHRKQEKLRMKATTVDLLEAEFKIIQNLQPSSQQQLPPDDQEQQFKTFENQEEQKQSPSGLIILSDLGSKQPSEFGQYFPEISPVESSFMGDSFQNILPQQEQKRHSINSKNQTPSVPRDSTQLGRDQNKMTTKGISVRNLFKMQKEDSKSSRSLSRKVDRNTEQPDAPIKKMYTKSTFKKNQEVKNFRPQPKQANLHESFFGLEMKVLENQISNDTELSIIGSLGQVIIHRDLAKSPSGDQSIAKIEAINYSCDDRLIEIGPDTTKCDFIISKKDDSPANQIVTDENTFTQTDQTRRNEQLDSFRQIDEITHFIPRHSQSVKVVDQKMLTEAKEPDDSIVSQNLLDSEIDSDNQKFSILTVSDSELASKKATTNKLKEDFKEMITLRKKNLSFSELRKDKNFKPVEKEERIKYMEQCLKTLSQENLGYFNGRKVPFAKTQGQSQCCFNPYKNDGSIITVQVIGKQLSSINTTPDQNQDLFMDDLSRKMEFNLLNSKQLKINRLMQDADLFEPIPPKESQIHKFGKIEETIFYDCTIKDSINYSILSFWEINQLKKLQVMHHYSVPNTLSREINHENSLQEVLFQSENLNLPFLFSKKTDSDELILNLVLDPSINDNQARTTLQGGSKGPRTRLTDQDRNQGTRLSIELKPTTPAVIQRIAICKDSFLEQQIWSYLGNKKLSFGKNRILCFPQRAPTLVKIQEHIFLVLSNTTDKTQKMSLCFIKIPYKKVDAAGSRMYTYQNALEADPTCGEIFFEVPGAEMFLGIDSKEENIFYLTNKKLANLANSCTDPNEARFSSPPIVKMISFEKIKELKKIQEKIALPKVQSEELELLEYSSEDPEILHDEVQSPNDQLQKLMDELPFWEVKGNQQSMDYFRVYSIDFPYVQGSLHDDNSRISLLFSGLETRHSVALTFSLTKPTIKEATIKSEKNFLEKSKTYKPKSDKRQVEIALMQGHQSFIQNKVDPMLSLEELDSIADLVADHDVDIFEGWFSRGDEIVPFELSARFMAEDEADPDRQTFENVQLPNTQLTRLIQESAFNSIVSNRNQLKVKCHATDKHGEQYNVQLGPEREEWKNLQFPNYSPFCPFKLKNLGFDGKTYSIKDGEGSIESSGTKFTISPQPGFKNEQFDNDGYPNETRFELVCNSSSFAQNGIKLTLKGYCQLKPFNQRLFLLYQESNAKSQETISRRVILERKANMSLNLTKIGQVKDVSDEEELSPEDYTFNVMVNNGVIEGKGQIKLQAKGQEPHFSLFTEYAKKLIKSSENEVYILYGSLSLSISNIHKGFLKEHMKLVEVTKPRPVAKKHGKGIDASIEQGVKELKLKELQIPVSEICQRIHKGGDFYNEDGLIYCMLMKSEQDVQIMTVAYEFHHSAPEISFFNFDLTKLINEQTGEAVERHPTIDSPIPQHYISDFPIIAYKSLLSNNSEIVLANFAQKQEPQQTLRMENWQLICFVHHATLKQFPEIIRFDSNILFLARHEKLGKVRLFILKTDPWIDVQDKKTFGTIDVFSTIEFKLPEKSESLLKKVDLLVGEDIEQKLQMSLIFQYEDSLWNVSLTTPDVTQLLLSATSDLQMMKRLTVRNGNHESYLFQGAFNEQDQVYRLLRISLDQEKFGECKMENIYQNENFQFVAIEVDPEESNFLYVLDEEQKLHHLLDTGEGKSLVQSTYDLSVHQLQEVLEDFKTNHAWASVSIDSRCITIKNQTYSKITNFSWMLLKDEDSQKKRQVKSVGQRAQRLLYQHPISDSLFIMQVWNAQEYYFFRVKPLPGSAIIDLLGQRRTGQDCRMHFVNEEHVMINIQNQRSLTFDKEGSVISKKFEMYKSPLNILRESSIISGVKFFVVQDQSQKISVIKEEKTRVEPQIQVDSFSLQELEDELKKLDNSILIELLNLKDPLHIAEVSKVAASIQLHHEHMIISKFGILYLVASCVFGDLDNNLSIFQENLAEDKKKLKEDFTYEHSKKLMGFYNFGNVQIMMIVCRSKTQQTSLTKQKVETDYFGVGDANFRRGMTKGTSLVLEADNYEVENQLCNFNFAIVEDTIIWVNFAQKKVWELATSEIEQISPFTTKSEQLKLSGSQIKKIQSGKVGICWRICDCKSFLAQAIFQGLTAEEFEDNGISINEIKESSMLRRKKIPEQDDNFAQLVQFTVANNAFVFDLTDQKPHIVDTMKGIDEIKDPLYFASSGFEYISNGQTMESNTEQTLGLIRPFSSTQITGVYRGFAEIDFRQMLKLQDIILNMKSFEKKDLGEIELLATTCIYNDETFFSIFAEHGILYQVVYDQIIDIEQQKERQLLSKEDFELYMRRVRYVITRPTPVLGKDNSLLTYLSILKQCVLLACQKSRVSIYRLADKLTDLDITDYISCTDDLNQVITYLTSAQYSKMFGKFQENVYTMSISEAVMPKRDQLKTFCGYTSIITKDHEEFGLHKDIPDDSALRKVLVRVMPLNWVYFNGSQLSTLFREFRGNQEKYQGSELLDVMFETFWSDFKWKIFGFCFVPYLAYFVASFIYITTMLYQVGEEAPDWQFNADHLLYMDTYELPLRIILIVLLLFQLFVQTKQMINDGIKRYLLQFQNCIDLLSNLLNATVLICRYLNANESFDINSLRFIGAVAGLFLWLQIVFWLRLFDGTAQYVSLVLETINDIFSFMVILIMIIMSFGTAVYLLQLNRIYSGLGADELLYPYVPGDNLFYSAILNQYFITLGEFGGIVLNNEDIVDQTLATIFFTLSTFLSMITILNMLIAIMGETFSNNMQEQDVKSKEQKLILLSKYIESVEFYMNTCFACLKKQKPLFVFVVTRLPNEQGDDEDDDEGENQLRELHRTVEKKFENLETLMNKKMVKGLQQLANETRSGLANLQVETKVKMNNVQTTIMKEIAAKLKLQETQIDSVKAMVEKEVIVTQKANLKLILGEIGKQSKVLEEIKKRRV